MTVNIAINGYGRIGRLVHRIISQRPDINLVAINDLVPADNLAYLLQYDSTHGRFKSKVEARGSEIIVEKQENYNVFVRKKSS